jgi:hypothetical protein
VKLDGGEEAGNAATICVADDEEVARAMIPTVIIGAALKPLPVIVRLLAV